MENVGQNPSRDGLCSACGSTLVKSMNPCSTSVCASCTQIRIAQLVRRDELATGSTRQFRPPRNPRALHEHVVRKGLGGMSPRFGATCLAGYRGIAGRSVLHSTGIRRSHRIEASIRHCQEAGSILGVQSATLGNSCRRPFSPPGDSFRLIGLIRREMATCGCRRHNRTAPCLVQAAHLTRPERFGARHSQHHRYATFRAHGRTGARNGRRGWDLGNPLPKIDRQLLS